MARSNVAVQSNTAFIKGLGVGALRNVNLHVSFLFRSGTLHVRTDAD